MALFDILVNIEADTGSLVSGLQKATSSLDKFQASIDNLITKGISFGAIALSLDKVEQSLSAVVTHEAEISNLSETLGIAASSLSQLQYAASISNVPDLGTNLEHLARSAGLATQGTNAQAAAFAAIGVSVKDANGNLKPTEQLLDEIATKFAGYADGAGKAAIAQALFGRGGASMVPLLNQGAAGIEKLKAEGDALGATISGPASAAANQFENDLTRLKTALEANTKDLTDGLIPSLDAAARGITTFITESRGGPDDLSAFSIAIKSLATAGLTAAYGFETLKGDVVNLFEGAGDEINTYAQAAALAVMGKFSLASAALKQGHDQIDKLDAEYRANQEKQWKAFGDALGKIWDDIEQKQQDAAKKGNKPPTPALPNLAQQQTSLKALQQFEEQLQTQVATFGLGKAAATEYDLQFGKLADDIKKGGKDAEQYRGKIEALAIQLQKKVDDQALTQIDAQILQLTGHTVEAAAELFDLQNKALVANLTSTGDTAGLKRVADLKAQTLAQAQFNQLQQDASLIETDLAGRIQAITDAQQAGAITSLAAMSQEDEARQNAITQLTTIHDSMQSIANQANSPQMIEGAEKFGQQIEQTAAQVDQLAKQIRDDFVNAGTDAFAGFITGSKSAGQAFKDFAASVLSDIAKIEAKHLSESIFGYIAHAFGGATSTAGASGGAQAGDVLPGGQIQGFATGGEFDVGGSGATDSQLIQFRATPGEHVQIGQPGRSAPVIHFAPVYQIGSGVDRAQVIAAMEQTHKRTIADMSRLIKGGAFAAAH